MILLICHQAGGRSLASEKRPLWTTDLRKQGFLGRPPGGMDAQEQITFGNAHEIAIVSTAAFAMKEPAMVKAFVLDADTGSVIAKKEWMIDYGQAEIHATASGKYLTSSSDGPRAFSLGLKDALPSPARDVGTMSVEGAYFLVGANREEGWRPGHALSLMIDADSYQPTGAEFLNGNYESVGGGRVATVGFKDGKAYVSVDGLHESFEPFVGSMEAKPRFVSESLLAIFGCGTIQVVDLAGNRLFETNMLPDDLTIAPAARDGSRFATVTPHTKGHWSILVDETVRVIDVQAKKEVLSVKIRPPDRWMDDEGSGVALAPDGSGMAVNTGGIVRYFGLPPKASSPPDQHR